MLYAMLCGNPPFETDVRFVNKETFLQLIEMWDGFPERPLPFVLFLFIHSPCRHTWNKLGHLAINGQSHDSANGPLF